MSEHLVEYEYVTKLWQMRMMCNSICIIDHSRK